MAEYEKKVRKILSLNGCTFERCSKGDHNIWFSPITGRHITVDTKIKSRHTAYEIMKQSGINYKFYPFARISKEDRLISLNPNYPPLTGDDDRIVVLGKALGKAEEN